MQPEFFCRSILTIKVSTVHRENSGTTIYYHQSCYAYYIAITNPRILGRESDAYYVHREEESANFHNAGSLYSCG